jgi:hypothetical protein
LAQERKVPFIVDLPTIGLDDECADHVPGQILGRNV